MMIKDITLHDWIAFEELFKPHFETTMQLYPNDKWYRVMFAYMYQQKQEGIIDIFGVFHHHILIGFIQIQIDKPESDWCERVGWGFIRELYIHPKYRRKQFGKQLVQYVEEYLTHKGVPAIYLTADKDFTFWKKMGYTENGICQENDLVIYEKANA